MVDEGSAPKQSVVVAPRAAVSIAAHALSHSKTAVHGVLIGRFAEGRLVVTDAVAVCHEPPTRPLTEMALALVQARVASSGDCIVGWYVGPEILEDVRPGPVPLRIVANLAENNEEEPTLVVVNNVELANMCSGKSTSSAFLQAHGKDFGGQWMEKLSTTIDKESGVAEALQAIHMKGTALDFLDLVDHWQKGASSEWSSSSAIDESLKQFCS